MSVAGDLKASIIRPSKAPATNQKIRRKNISWVLENTNHFLLPTKNNGRKKNLTKGSVKHPESSGQINFKKKDKTKRASKNTAKRIVRGMPLFYSSLLQSEGRGILEAHESMLKSRLAQ